MMLFLAVLCSLWLVCSSSSVLQSYLNSSEWWLVKNLTNANVYLKLENSLVFLRHADLDSHNVHSCYEYALFDKHSESIVKTRSFCFPSVVVGGYKKCSTSALYEFIEESPLFNKAKGKEICMMKKSLVALFDWFPEEITDDRYFINGCIYWDLNYVIHEVLRHPNTFYILIYRNYADYLWSAYNYWCSIPYDRQCTFDGEWLVPGKFIRTPQIFSQLVNAAAANDTKMLMPHYMVDSCNVGSHLFSNYTLSMWHSGIPPESTLLLANEDLDSHPNDTWHRISTALGLTAAHPKLEHFSQVKINANMKKGGFTAVNASKVTPGLYEISGYEPMFSKTRTVLNRCWVNDCQFVASLTQHSYPVCQNITSALKYSESDQKLIDDYKEKRLNVAYTADHSFRTVKVNQCKDLSSRHVHNHNGKAVSSVNSLVLVLSTSEVRRTFGTFLTHYLTSEHRVSSEDLSHTDSAALNRAGVCSSTPSGLVILTAHPDNVKLEIGEGGVIAVLSTALCPSPVKVNQLIVLMTDRDDYLLQAFKKKASTDLWKRDVVAQLRRFDGLTSLEGSFWKKPLSATLESLMGHSMMMVLHLHHQVKVDRVNNYQNVLLKCIEFLFSREGVTKPPLSSVITTLPKPSDFAQHQAVDLLYCSHLKVLDTIPISEDVNRDLFRRSWMEATAALSNDTHNVYSNVQLVCQAEKYLEKRALALSSLRRRVSGGSYCSLTEAEVPPLWVPPPEKHTKSSGAAKKVYGPLPTRKPTVSVPIFKVTRSPSGKNGRSRPTRSPVMAVKKMSSVSEDKKKVHKGKEVN